MIQAKNMVNTDLILSLCFILEFCIQIKKTWNMEDNSGLMIKPNEFKKQF